MGVNDPRTVLSSLRLTDCQINIVIIIIIIITFPINSIKDILSGLRLAINTAPFCLCLTHLPHLCCARVISLKFNELLLLINNNIYRRTHRVLFIV